jgi:catechol 2,3-dioxygenase-like lactoylglutathione lyase family enzyme
MPTLYVSDLDASVAFYTAKLGLDLIERTDEHAVVGTAGLRVGLYPATPAAPRPGTSGAITVGFGVAAPIEEAVGRLKERGVWFRGPVVQHPAGKRAFFGDPDGNDLYLWESP